MNECVFCAIASKKIKSRIVYEDDATVSVLDITPKSKGMCLVIPKKHFDFFDEDIQTATKTFKSALIVAQKVKTSLNPLTIFFASLQAQIPHFNIRVYPVYENQIPLIENRPIEVDEKEMDEIANKIKSIDVNLPEEIETEESVEEEPKQEIVEIEKKVAVEKDDRHRDDKKFWFKKSFETA